MAQHWSNFVAVTERQARALDKMADAHGFRSGRELLCEVAGGISTSKLSKLDRLTVAGIVDKAFAEYGRNAQKEN